MPNVKWMSSKGRHKRPAYGYKCPYVHMWQSEGVHIQVHFFFSSQRERRACAGGAGGIIFAQIYTRPAAAGKAAGLGGGFRKSQLPENDGQAVASGMRGNCDGSLRAISSRAGGRGR